MKSDPYCIYKVHLKEADALESELLFKEHCPDGKICTEHYDVPSPLDNAGWILKELYDGADLISADGQWILTLVYSTEGRTLMLKHCSNESHSYFVKNELTWVIVAFNSWKVRE